MQLRDRVVLVTGAASGIGRALCLQLGRDGARLGLVDRDEAGLERFRVELKTAGVADGPGRRRRPQARAGAFGRRLADASFGPGGRPHPCAGLCGFEVVDDLNVPQVENMLQINFLGVVYAIDACCRDAPAQAAASIVGIASLAAVRAIPFERPIAPARRAWRPTWRACGRPCAAAASW